MPALKRFAFPLVCTALWVAGCQHSGPVQTRASGGDSIPGPDPDTVAGSIDQAKMVASGVNKQLTYKAPKYGKLYLYDAETGQFVFRGTVAPGEQFLFEPASSRAQINKQTIDLERGTNEKDEYRLYFAPQ